MEPDDLALFQRSLRYATATFDGAALDDALEDLGWCDALASDTTAAVASFFELQGSAGTSCAALAKVVAHGLQSVNGPMAALLPALGSAAAPGLRRGDVVHVSGVTVEAIDEAEPILVAVRDGAWHFTITTALQTLERRPVAGIDPAFGLVSVTGDLDVGDYPEVVDWDVAASLGQIAIGHELVGASRRMLEMAREHALDRVQFDRPIAGFQAVRHRLAEALVAIEAADAAVAAAWLDGTSESASMAKAFAARCARTAARHCQQVLAGIGFTTEHDFHRYLRRIVLLDQLLGSGKDLTRDLGRRIVETGALPPLLPL